MPTIKKSKKEDKKETYFYAVGRRKASIAQVRIYADDKAAEDDFTVNGKDFKVYFPTLSLQTNFLSSLRGSGLSGKFRSTILVRGGGIKGQSEACRLGIARAIVKYDAGLKKMLKDQGFLTRDSRVVERKKPGLKKARRAPQWAKR